MHDLFFYLYLFSAFSFVGWVLEFVYRSVRARRIINPGFARGPYLPLYGFAAIILTKCISIMQNHYLFFMTPVFNFLSLTVVIPDSIEFKLLGLVSKTMLYFLVTSGIEFVTGVFFHRVLNRPLWDYSGESLSLGNLVCLKYSCYWILLSFSFEYALLPLSMTFLNFSNPTWVHLVTSVLCLVIAIDFTRQLTIALRALRNQHGHDMQPDIHEFNRILAPLLNTNEVKSLAAHKHHWNRNRLEHSLEVAWYGYVLSKKLSLDYVAAARGGLLHDLFFYDWLTEGPRLHGFRHPAISLRNAQKITDLTSKECDIIKKHMWPLTLIPPRYVESWIICTADTYCSIKDYIISLRRLYEG